MKMEMGELTDAVFGVIRNSIETDVKNGHMVLGDEAMSIQERVCAACECLHKYTPGDVSDSGLSDALRHTVIAACLTINNAQLFVENVPSDA